MVSLYFQPSTPTKPVVFAEWVAGMRPPDPNTINKHVHDMVEVRWLFYIGFPLFIFRFLSLTDYCLEAKLSLAF